MLSPETLLSAWLFLLLSAGFITPSKYLYSEVIVPRQLEVADTSRAKAGVSYIIKMEGNHRIIHLKKKSFITSNMPVYSYNLKGVAIADYPYIQDDCYYNGFVEDSQDSQVVLSTCTGLWGHMQIGSFRYEIEPIENSSTFQHLIYRRDSEQRQLCRGVLVEGADLKSGNPELKMIDNHTLIPSEKSTNENFNSYASVRYLEYYAVADKSKFVAENRNESRLVSVMLLMMADVHSVYFEMGLRIYLVGLELWTEKDHVRVDAANLGMTLGAFYQYTISELQHRVHFDHSVIITTKGSPAGLAWGDHFCLHSRASVSAVRAYGNLAFDAETIAHQLGHSLGFTHDDTPQNKAQGCDCHCLSPGKCMMSSGYIACRRLSNCSKKVYYDTIRKPGKECLLNLPTKVFKQKICGNGVLEDNEECDCGHSEEEGGIVSLFVRPQAKEDIKKSELKESSKDQNSSAESQRTKELAECLKNGCCQKDCKLKPGIDCLHGLCCKNCKFSEVGATCREAASECDLPEFCNGSSADCPPDAHKQNGMPCGSKDNCYAGKCLNLHQHCTDLFGRDAKPAPLVCFMAVNLQGDQSGNCGQQGLKYKKCKEEDVLCGRVQCINVKNIPKMSIGQAVVQTPVEHTWCWGTELRLGKDLGAVKDGTTCGSDKICINRSCVDIDVLNLDCDFKKCNYRGVCNSKQNCHCTYGWAPPFCEAKGYGGSIDSGPPPPYMMPVGLIVGIVTVVGLFLLALLFVTTLKREKLHAWLDSVIPTTSAPVDDTGSMRSQQSQSNLSSSVKSQASLKRSNTFLTDE